MDPSGRPNGRPDQRPRTGSERLRSKQAPNAQSAADIRGTLVERRFGYARPPNAHEGSSKTSERRFRTVTGERERAIPYAANGTPNAGPDARKGATRY